MPSGSAELRPGGDMRVDHEEVELFFLALLMDGGDEHTAAFNAHHGSGREVDDGDEGLADKLFGLIKRVDARKDRAIRPGAVVEGELQELFRLLHRDAVLDLDGAEIGFAEGLKVDAVFKQGFNDHVGKVGLGIGDEGRALNGGRGGRNAAAGMTPQPVLPLIGCRAAGCRQPPPSADGW